MAFVRWRSNGAELLATVYDHGRSRQVRLACLGGAYHVYDQTRAQVAQRFPDIVVDWEAVERALVLGPPAERAASGEPDHRLKWVELKHALRRWGAAAEAGEPRDAAILHAAADVLNLWRGCTPQLTTPPRETSRLPGVTASAPGSGGEQSTGPGRDHGGDRRHGPGRHGTSTLWRHAGPLGPPTPSQSWNPECPFR